MAIASDTHENLQLKQNFYIWDPENLFNDFNKYLFPKVTMY